MLFPAPGGGPDGWRGVGSRAGGGSAGATATVRARVDDEVSRAAADESPGRHEASTPPPLATDTAGPTLAFVLRGVSAAGCRGVVTLMRDHGEASTQPIAGADFAVAMEPDVRRIDIAVDGHVVVCYSCATARRALASNEQPIEVHLAPAGEILVDVVDSAGHPLAERYVQCFGLADLPPDDDEPLRMRTSSWAWTDARGVARIQNVPPGSYRVDTNPIAEWQAATVRPVQVAAGHVASCRLDVPVLPPDEFGGFEIPANAADFLSSTGSGKVRYYRFRTEAGATHDMFRIGDAIRCVVRGGPGATVRGRIQPTGGSGPEPLQRSEPITVTIGAMPTIHPTWLPANAK